MKYIKDFEVANKRVIVRCDFNVPIDDNGAIMDDFKIRSGLATIQYLVKKKAKVILMTHLGDPDGAEDQKFSLGNVGKRLEELLGMPVVKISDCVGPEASGSVLQLQKGHILLLENVRFHPEEKENNVEFAKKLSELGEIYINDAFSECHRAYASIVGIPQFLPHGAGLLLQQEMQNLTKILHKPKRPMVALIGGAKIESKAKFIDRISSVADVVMVGGLIKKELLAEKIPLQHPEKVIGPEDSLDAPDISEVSAELFCQKILKAKTVFWNGPLGRFEDGYEQGTLKIAKAIIKSKAFSVVGGGQTIEFLHKEGILSKFSHVSTGGGAMLDFLSGEELVGIKALES